MLSMKHGHEVGFLGDVDPFADAPDYTLKEMIPLEPEEECIASALNAETASEAWALVINNDLRLFDKSNTEPIVMLARKLMEEGE